MVKPIDIKQCTQEKVQSEVEKLHIALDKGIEHDVGMVTFKTSPAIVFPNTSVQLYIISIQATPCTTCGTQSCAKGAYNTMYHFNKAQCSKVTQLLSADG